MGKWGGGGGLDWGGGWHFVLRSSFFSFLFLHYFRFMLLKRFILPFSFVIDRWHISFYLLSKKVYTSICICS